MSGEDDTSISLAYQDLEEIPIETAREKGTQTRSLDLTENMIKDGGNLSFFTNLDSLVLDKNDMEELVNFPPIPSLKTLSLNNNSFEDLHEVMDVICEKYPNLEYLFMMRNPVNPAMLGMDLGPEIEEKSQRYRMYVLYRMQGLRFLDCTDVTKDEMAVAVQKGQFAVTRKAKRQNVSKTVAEEDSGNVVVQPTHAQGSSRAFLALGSNMYDGRHSEGNRFIVNQDL